MRLKNRVWAWASSTSIYVKESVENVEKYLAELADTCWKFLKKKSKNPLVRDYAPDMDKTPDIYQELESWYQYLIVIIRWIVEIDIMDIITEVSMMASQMAIHREGHLENSCMCLYFSIIIIIPGWNLIRLILP